MAKKKKSKLTGALAATLAALKRSLSGRRKAALKSGEYDGRFRPRRDRDKSKYNRTDAKKEWK